VGAIGDLRSIESESVPQDLDNERAVGNGIKEDLLGRVSSNEIKGRANGIPWVGGISTERKPSAEVRRLSGSPG